MRQVNYIAHDIKSIIKTLRSNVRLASLNQCPERVLCRN